MASDIMEVKIPGSKIKKKTFTTCRGRKYNYCRLGFTISEKMIYWVTVTKLYHLM